jgi:predicted metal-dependent hydrolase
MTITTHQISTPEGTFEYELHRSHRRRRTMQIGIRHEGLVQVHAPVSFSMTAIEGFIRTKASWILGKLSIFHERRRLLETRRTSDFKECFFLGHRYPLKFLMKDTRWGQIGFDDNGWLIEIPQRVGERAIETYLENFMEKWFKSRAMTVLKERVAHYAQLMNDQPSAIRIRSPKSLWGSCHPTKRVLHFNWRILMAPVEVVDYLVVHEMSHMKVADHSARFWTRVKTFCPDYKARQQWLKHNGFQLRLPFGE